MDKSTLLDICVHSRRHAEYCGHLISYQQEVIGNLEGDGVDVSEARRLLAALIEIREKDLAEMERALDELDSPERQIAG